MSGPTIKNLSLKYEYERIDAKLRLTNLPPHVKELCEVLFYAGALGLRSIMAQLCGCSEIERRKVEETVDGEFDKFIFSFPARIKGMKEEMERKKRANENRI